MGCLKIVQPHIWWFTWFVTMFSITLAISGVTPFQTKLYICSILLVSIPLHSHESPIYRLVFPWLLIYATIFQWVPIIFHEEIGFPMISPFHTPLRQVHINTTAGPLVKSRWAEVKVLPAQLQLGATNKHNWAWKLWRKSVSHHLQHPLVAGFKHFLFFHRLGIIIPTD